MEEWLNRLTAVIKNINKEVRAKHDLFSLTHRPENTPELITVDDELIIEGILFRALIKDNEILSWTELTLDEFKSTCTSV